MKKLLLILIAIVLYDPGMAYSQIKLTDEEKYDRFEDTWEIFLDYYGNLCINRDARARRYDRKRTAEYAGEVTRGMRAARYEAEALFLSQIGPVDNDGFINDNKTLLESLAEEDTPIQKLTAALGEKGLLKEEYDNLSRLIFVKTYFIYACKYLDLTGYGSGITETLLHNVVDEISAWGGGSGKWAKSPGAPPL
jgi:hypothetical protein